MLHVLPIPPGEPPDVPPNHGRNVLIETHVLDDPTGPANLYILVSDKNN